MNEITLKDEAIRLDSEIQMYASQMGSAIYNIGRCMQAMKEKELYKELGFNSFEAYAEEKYQLKKSQAAKYISVYQNLDEKYILENQGAGIQKLYMLSQITEEDRENIEGNPDELSISELKAELERVKQEREGIQMQLFDLQSKQEIEDESDLAGRAINHLNEQIEELKSEKEASEKKAKNSAAEASKLKTDNEWLEMCNKQLKDKLDKFESQPKEVVVAEPDENTINSIVEERMAEKAKTFEQEKDKALKEADIKSREKIEELQRQLQEQKEETENIRKGYEKKIEAVKASAEKEKSTQVEAAEEETEDAKMKRLLSGVVMAANMVLEAIPDTADPEGWSDKVVNIFNKMIEKIMASSSEEGDEE